MCYGCYEDYGFPALVSDKTLAAADLVKRLFDLSCVGGNLHIVVDDWNIEDSNLAFCAECVARSVAGKPGRYDTTDPETVAAEVACLSALQALTIEERATALAIYDGYLSRDGTATEELAQLIGGETLN
jgi:hypothetical protein